MNHKPDLMENKKIVMCGCHEVGLNNIKVLLESGLRIDYFVTVTKEKAQQQKISGYVSFEALARKYNIPIYYVKKYSLKDEEDLSFFQEHGFDLLIQGGWQRLFPDNILSTLKIGAVGVHGSSEFLPKGRGRSPINWSLIEGKKRFILHFFLMKPGIDDGDIFHYEIFDINEWDNCKTLYYKNAIVTAKVLSKYIPKLLNKEYEIYEQKGEPSYYPKRVEQDGLINWDNTVFQIYDFIRALTRPYPGAFTHVNGVKVFIWKAQPFDAKITYQSSDYGEIVEIFSSRELVVKCNSGLLLVTEYESALNLEKGNIFKNG